MSAISLIQEQINEAKEHGYSIQHLSDGYHTFDGLYKHRIANFIALCRSRVELYTIGNIYDKHFGIHNVWLSKFHSDGSSYAGWFIMGINKEKGKQITYHIPESEWLKCTLIGEVLDRAPEWDGHTPADVLKRLAEL